jgi:hypothetical protein
VESVRGEAFAQAGGATRPLVPAGTVFIGDVVSTRAASSLGLHLGPATLIRLGAEARLRIDRFLLSVGGVLELVQGAMLYAHAAATGSDVTIRSSFGLIAVRGTRFFAGPSGASPFGIFVIQGEVTVYGQNTAVRVAAGLGTDILRPGGEPEAPHPWGAQRVQEAIASVM